MGDRVENNVQKLRVAARKTQEDLASRVGVSRQTIISVEKGNYTPSVLLALKLAKALGTTVDELFAITS